MFEHDGFRGSQGAGFIIGVETVFEAGWSIASSQSILPTANAPASFSSIELPRV